MIHVKRQIIQKHLLILLLLEDNVFLVLCTISTTSVIKANLGEMLSSRTQKFFFKSRDVMQVSPLSAKLGPRSELCHWYRDTPSLPLVIWQLSCRHEPTIDYVLAQTLDPFLQNLSPWTPEHTKTLYWSSVPLIFPQMQNFFPSLLSQRVNQVPLRMYGKFSKRKPAKHEKTSRDKISKRCSVTVFKRITWNQSRDVLTSEEGLHLIRVNTPPVINRLSWYVAVRSHRCFCVQQQEFENSDSYMAGASKVSGWQNSTCQIDSLEKEKKQKLFPKGDTLVDKIIRCNFKTMKAFARFKKETWCMEPA